MVAVRENIRTFDDEFRLLRCWPALAADVKRQLRHGNTGTGCFGLGILAGRKHSLPPARFSLATFRVVLVLLPALYLIL